LGLVRLILCSLFNNFEKLSEKTDGTVELDVLLKSRSPDGNALGTASNAGPSLITVQLELTSFTAVIKKIKTF